MGYKKYTRDTKDQIKFDYESGEYSVRKLARKWNISTQTLKKFSDEGNWSRKRRKQKLSGEAVKEDRIVIDANEEVVLTSSEERQLAEYIKEHLEVIGVIDDTYKLLLTFHIQELKESGGLLSKADGDKWQSNYKALNIAMDSFDKSFRSKRLAMGLKEVEGPKVEMNFNLNKIENINGLTDKELDYIIANEGDIESKTIN
jgi:transposase-like protein